MNIIISETPNFPPNRCIHCGAVNSTFFIDLGINLSVHFNPVIYGGPGFDGALILCADCWIGLTKRGNQMIAQFIEAHEIDKEIYGSGVPTSINPATSENNRTTEQYDHESTDSDSESSSAESDDEVSEFTDFFGGNRLAFGGT